MNDSAPGLASGNALQAKAGARRVWSGTDQT
jgi:hypothetical protein